MSIQVTLRRFSELSPAARLVAMQKLRERCSSVPCIVDMPEKQLEANLLRDDDLNLYFESGLSIPTKWVN